MNDLRNCIRNPHRQNVFVLWNALSHSNLWDLIADDAITKLISEALLGAGLLDAKNFWEIKTLATMKSRFQALVLAFDLLLLNQQRFWERERVLDIVITALYRGLSDSVALTYCSHLRVRLLLQKTLSLAQHQWVTPEKSMTSQACVSSQPLEQTELQSPLSSDVTTSRSRNLQLANEDRNLVNMASENGDVASTSKAETVNIYSELQLLSGQDFASGELDLLDYNGASGSCVYENKRKSKEMNTTAAAFETRKKESDFSQRHRGDHRVMEISGGLTGDYYAKSNSKERKLGGGITQKVTVRNGEINDVLERSGRLNSLSCLDKLRNFTGGVQTEKVGRHCDVTHGDSDGGFVSHDEDDNRSLSSFASGSSYSSEILNGWLNEEEFDSRHHSLLGRQGMEASIASISEEIGEHSQTKTSSDTKETQREYSTALPAEVGISDGSKDTETNVLAKPQKTPLVSRNPTCTSQREVFWAVEHELRSVVDFRKVLPDLLKFNIFTTEQKSRYRDFKGQYSGAILQAVGERVDQTESIMGPFLLALRPYYPDIVNGIHQRVFREVHSQRQKQEKEQVSITTQDNATKPESPYRRFDTCHQVSPYSRRPFTINTARDQDHVTNIQKHYMTPPASSRYFSKDHSKHRAIPDNYETSLTNRQPTRQSTFVASNTNKDVATTATNHCAGKDQPEKIKSPNANSKPAETTSKKFENQTDINSKGDPNVLELMTTNKTRPRVEKNVISPEEGDQTQTSKQVLEVRNRTETSVRTSAVPNTSSLPKKENQSADTSVVSPPKIKNTSVRRASSFQERRTKRVCDATDKPSSEARTKRSNLLKNYFEQKEVNKTTLKSLSYGILGENIQKEETHEKLGSRFRGSLSPNDDTENDRTDPDAVLAELVKRCVISARTGWLIRRLPKVSERRNHLLSLLAELPDGDVCEINESCPLTVEFVKQNCGLDKKSTKVKTEKVSPVIDPRLSDKEVTLTSALESKLETTSSTANANPETVEKQAVLCTKKSTHSKTQECTSKPCDEDLNDDIHSVLNRKISNYDDRSEIKRDSGEKEREELHIRVTLEPSSSSHSEALLQKSYAPSDKFSNEEIRVTQEGKGRLLNGGVDPEQGGLSDSKRNVKQSSKPALKISLNEKGKHSAGTQFVSQVLFPISKRKNAESRKSQKLFEKETPSNELEIKQMGFETKHQVAMSPILCISTAAKDKQDENNNLCSTETICKPSRAILTNGGGLSPPSSKKKGARVSFSNLPPIEIELEPQDGVWDPSSNSLSTEVTELVTDSVPTLTVKSEPVEQESLELKTAPNEPMKPVIVAKNKKTKPVNHSINEIDQINELLMDILEEIEGESVSLNQYLYNLVKDGLMTEEVAVSISPTFTEFQNRPPSPTGEDYYQSDLEKERGVEKLLDVLTNLGLEKLSRCRNCLLGRLCQLSTYEDFESAQKAAAASASDSSPELSKKRKPLQPFPTGTRSFTNRRKLSVEDCELSATESDEDFYFLHHQIGRQRFDVSDNPTIEEEEDEVSTQAEKKQKNDARFANSKQAVDFKAILPVLIDENVIAPRHAWLILGAGSEKEQKAKLKHFLLRTDEERLRALYSLPHLTWLRILMEDKEINAPSSKPKSSFLKARDRFQRPGSKLGRSTSLRESNLQGRKPPNFSDVAHLVEEHAAARKEQEERLSPPLEAILKTRGSGLRRTHSMINKTEKFNNPDGKEPGESIERWCERKNLTSNLATALRNRGYHRSVQLRGITETEIERLEGVGWMEKTKVWVTVENLRLEEFYHRTHNDLADIMKILDK